ncbi:MAG: hypothetical protein EVB02_02330 [SAR92 clade bacterium]|uniref:Uncharacterized protein n=1 Tax=SAR92 clade bacterium TaxID=2315479 RepID=A0A520LM29_9GAMM|nr:MAG: hypothetical protein EVB02_02330 [SAR92 clade bacterium]|tara:strand:+ start:660 stop:1019 length:360 start_codon:yes stop_codon:yes gene_type:complete
MGKKNLTWIVNYKSHRIEIQNNYDFIVRPPQGGGKLLIDDREVQTWELILPLPNKPFVSIEGISEKIYSIKLYGAGAFRTKLSVEVNNEFIYQDKLNVFDKYFIKNPKLIEKVKKSTGL